MKKLILPLIAIVLFTACGNDAATESESVMEAEAAETTMVDPDAEMDPVCEMVKDDSWTDYSVNGTDTTWFCSEVCKGAYEARPEKYSKG